MLLMIGFIYVCAEMQQGPVRVAVARECESPSHRYKGPCARDANCASVCQTEGFSGGKCVGFRARCFCVKAC